MGSINATDKNPIWPPIALTEQQLQRSEKVTPNYLGVTIVFLVGKDFFSAFSIETAEIDKHTERIFLDVKESSCI